MRITTATMTLALAALVTANATGQQAQRPAGPADTRPAIAVLDFDLGATLGQSREDYEALRRGLASLTINEIAANTAIRVVERTQLQQILQEQNLGREGRVDPQTLSRIGKLIGATYMISGTFFDLRGDVKVVARIFNVETGEILRTQEVRGRLENLFDLVPRLGQQIMTGANLPPLERRAADEFRQANPAPPTQAVMAYSRAVLYADRGDKEHAVEQYRRALTTFPAYTQARTACNSLQSGACPG